MGADAAGKSARTRGRRVRGSTNDHVAPAIILMSLEGKAGGYAPADDATTNGKAYFHRFTLRNLG